MKCNFRVKYYISDGKVLSFWRKREIFLFWVDAFPHFVLDQRTAKQRNSFTPPGCWPVWVEQPFLPTAHRLPHSHAPPPLPHVLPTGSRGTPARCLGFPRPLQPPAPGHRERTVTDTRAAVGPSWAAAATGVMAGDGRPSASNYGTETISSVLNPRGPFICSQILLGDFVGAVTVRGLCCLQ